VLYPITKEKSLLKNQGGSYITQHTFLNITLAVNIKEFITRTTQFATLNCNFDVQWCI